MVMFVKGRKINVLINVITRYRINCDNEINAIKHFNAWTKLRNLAVPTVNTNIPKSNVSRR